MNNLLTQIDLNLSRSIQDKSKLYSIIDKNVRLNNLSLDLLTVRRDQWDKSK